MVGKNSEALRVLQDNEKLGSISYGQSKIVNYSENPLYRAYSFAANAGDTVDIWVKSSTPTDALAWLLAADYTTLAQNDNADSGTKDAHIQYAVSTAGTYWIAMREANQESATFTVSLNGNSAPNDVFDPNLCTGGARMTHDQALHYFQPGTEISNAISNATVYGRQRDCNQATGCGPWRAPSGPIYWDYDDAPVTGGRFYAQVGYNSEISLRFKRSLSDSQEMVVSNMVGTADPLPADTTWKNDANFKYALLWDLFTISSFSLQANTTCFALHGHAATLPNNNSQYREGEIVVYGATLPPIN